MGDWIVCDTSADGEELYSLEGGYFNDGGGSLCDSRRKRLPGFTSFLVRERVRWRRFGCCGRTSSGVGGSEDGAVDGSVVSRVTY